MSSDEFTAEEQAAMEAMESDTGEDIKEEPVTQEEPKEGQQAETPEQMAEELEGEKQPEFKSSRTEEKPPEGYVPHQAMHAERLKRQELERRLEAIEAERQQAQEPAPPEYVDPLIDPDAHRKWAEYQTQQPLQKLEQLQSQMQAQQQRSQMLQSVSQAEEQFMTEAKDYPDAVNHLRTHREQELLGQGYSPQQAQAQMAQDAAGIVQAAQQLGMNPAQLAYMRAQSMGYTPKQAQATAQQATQSDQGAGAKIEALGKAQAATEGLSSSGAPKEGGLTAEALANMPEKEFAKLSEEEIAKAMGA